MARTDESLAKQAERWCHYGAQLVAHAAVHALPGRGLRERCSLDEPACARNFAVRGYRHHVLGHDTPACCRMHLLGVLDDVVACLEPTDWTWFVFWGGFLGSARDGELVPWDRDLDIAVVDVAASDLLAVLEPLTGRGRHLRLRGATTPHLVRVQASSRNGIGVDVERWRREGDVLVALDPDIAARPRVDLVLPLVGRPLAGRGLRMPRSPALLADLYGPDWATRGVRVEQRFGRRVVDLLPAGGPQALALPIP
ncbi:MAG: hypothetical protein AB7T63_00660 [Planctomycetota bacterium]